jgi:hypothetical protein
MTATGIPSIRACLIAAAATLASVGALPFEPALGQPLPPMDAPPPPPDLAPPPPPDVTPPPGAASTEDFREALADLGSWVAHRRWGEVWIPANLQQDWRPYTRGRWVYTDEWGWYWVSDDPWGWITDHYGRWVFDQGLGWIWVAGEEWSPAWVQWRQGAQHVGWAPLPPEDIVYDYDDDPNVWMFVRAADLTAPRVYTVFVPIEERPLYIRETIIVNRTVPLRQRGLRIAVNPGIAPGFIAAASRRPIRAVALRPPVLPRTFGVRGAVTVRGDDWRRYRAGGPGAGPGGRPVAGGARVRVDPTRVTVRETTTTFRPGTNITAPTRLEHGQPGRYWDRAPRAVSVTPGGPVGPSGLRGPQGDPGGRPGGSLPQGGQFGTPPSGVRTGVQPAAPGGGSGGQRAPIRIEDRRPPPPSAGGPAGTPPSGVQRTTPPPTGVQRTTPPPTGLQQRTAPPPQAIQRTAPPAAPAVQRVAPPQAPAAVPRPVAPPPAAVQRAAPPPAAMQRQGPPPGAAGAQGGGQRAAPAQQGARPQQQQRPQRKPGDPEPPR